MRLSIIGLIVGLGVALGCILLNRLFHVVFGTWTLLLWPSSIILMGSADNETTRFATVSLLIAVFANGLIYSVVAFAIWKVAFARRR